VYLCPVCTWYCVSAWLTALPPTADYSVWLSAMGHWMRHWRGTLSVPRPQPRQSELHGLCDCLSQGNTCGERGWGFLVCEPEAQCIKFLGLRDLEAVHLGFSPLWGGTRVQTPHVSSTRGHLYRSWSYFIDNGIVFCYALGSHSLQNVCIWSIGYLNILAVFKLSLDSLEGKICFEKFSRCFEINLLLGWCVGSDWCWFFINVELPQKRWCGKSLTVPS